MDRDQVAKRIGLRSPFPTVFQVVLAGPTRFLKGGTMSEKPDPVKPQPGVDSIPNLKNLKELYEWLIENALSPLKHEDITGILITRFAIKQLPKFATKEGKEGRAIADDKAASKARCSAVLLLAEEIPESIMKAGFSPDKEIPDKDEDIDAWGEWFNEVLLAHDDWRKRFRSMARKEFELYTGVSRYSRGEQPVR